MPATMSDGYSSACSSAWACGMISLSTNSRTVVEDLLLDVGEAGGLGETGHVLVSLLMTPLDDAAVVQAGQLGGGEAEDLGEDLVGVAAEDRALPRFTVGAVPAQRRAGGDRAA